LKQLTGDAGARDYEGMFYALEQASLRVADGTPRGVKFASRMYELLSDYGRSFITPLYWLAALTAFCFSIFLLFFYWQDVGAACVSLYKVNGKCTLTYSSLLIDAAAFTAEQVFRPFDAIRRLQDDSSIVNLIMALIAALQSIFTLSLVALFLLALRRRFKLD
jgi:hypothetical protein